MDGWKMRKARANPTASQPSLGLGLGDTEDLLRKRKTYFPKDNGFYFCSLAHYCSQMAIFFKSCVCMCVYVAMHACPCVFRCAQRPEEEVGYSGAGVTNSSGLPDVANLSLLQD